ncbi:ABC transporter ATP-binding protein [Saliphagus sp. GCM10025334]
MTTKPDDTEAQENMSTQTEDSESQPVLQIHELDKSYQSKSGLELVLTDLDLTLEQGEFKCILGRSGCGKSTLLKCIAGLENYESGTIKGDLDNIGYVFQEDRLLNWRTVRENISLALESKGIPRSKHDERIQRYLELVGLEDELESYPLHLSGGMRQRVSIARALAIEPDTLLMDEPFSALDEINARRLREEFLEIITKLDQSVIFVTHNAREAVFLGSTVAVLEPTPPAKIKKEIDNPLEYPRDIDSNDVNELSKEIISYL